MRARNGRGSKKIRREDTVGEGVNREMGADWARQPRDKATGRWTMRSDSTPKRVYTLKIRLTEGERAQIVTAADASGMTMTAYIVDCCRRYKPIERDRFAAHRRQLVHRKRRRG